MKHVFRVFWGALKDFWDELFTLILMNIVTVLLAIPVVTFPPALAGLWNAANLAAKGRSVHWSDYFEGFRLYFLKAWGLALLTILVVVVVVTNVRFYTPGLSPFNINSTLSIWVRALFIVLGSLWVVMQMYPMALLLEQEDQRLRVALRNAAVLFVANPGFTVLLVLLLAVVAAISTVIPALWLLITLAFMAVVCNKAVQHLLEPYRERLRAAEAEGQAEVEGQVEAEEDTQES
jgi:uncharacterized membrane protein YesL